MRDFVTHVLRVSEDIREGSPADLKVAGESRWGFVVMKGGAEVQGLGGACMF